MSRLPGSASPLHRLRPVAGRLLTGLLALLLWLPASAFADFKKDYQDGLDAYNRGEFLEARRLMQAAIRANPTPQARMRTYGTNFVPYIPHHYLGMAEARLGDCTAALAAFRVPASQGVVSGLSAQASAQATQAGRCEEALLAQQRPPVQPPSDTTPTLADVTAPTAPPVAVDPTPLRPDPTPVRQVVDTAPPVTPLGRDRIAPTSAVLARAEQQIREADSRLRAAPLAGTGDARALAGELETLRRRQQQQQATLERARVEGNAELLASVSRDSATLERGVATLGERVEAARSGLLQAQAARALEQSRQRASTLAGLFERLLADAMEAGVPEHPSARAVQARRTQLQALTRSEDRDAIERELRAADAEQKALEAAIAAAPKPAPELLRSLVASYLAARFDDVAGWDRLDDLPDSRARAQALLLRAAARWHLYVRGGEQDARLGAAIDSDLRQARRLDSALQPNTRAFSPRLIERYAAL